MIQLGIKQALFPVLQVDTDENTAHRDQNLSLSKIFASWCTENDLKQMLKLWKLSSLK